jgi:hypothetical protein
MSAIEKKYDTRQDIVGILQQLPGGKAMPLPGVDLIKILQVERGGLVWTLEVD